MKLVEDRIYEKKSDGSQWILRDWSTFNVALENAQTGWPELVLRFTFNKNYQEAYKHD